MNGKIVVRKDNSTGKLDVEGKYILLHARLPVLVYLRSLTSNTNFIISSGPLCNDFYTVRSIVKGQFVTV